MLSYRDRKRIQEEKQAQQLARPSAHTHWVVRALNAPFMIWLLSAITLGIGASIFSGTQQCRSDAERSMEQYRRLSEEIYYRRELLNNAIREAKSIRDLRSSDVVRQWDQLYEFAEFKGRTLADLGDEFSQVALKVDVYPSIVIGISVLEARRRFEMARPGGPSNEWAELSRAKFQNATDDDLSEIKKLAAEEESLLRKAKLASIGKIGIPECGYTTVASRMLYGRPHAIASMRTINELN